MYLTVARKALPAVLLAIGLASGPAVATSGPAVALSEIAQPVFEVSVARVVSPRHADLAAAMDGIVTAIDAREAAAVTVGDTLFSFDCRGNRLALRRAELALQISQQTAAQASVALDRSSAGVANSSVSRAQNDADRLAYQTATLDVADKSLTRDAAALAVERCSVKAPFTGVVTAIAVGPGSYLTAGTLVLSMTETENLEVSAQLTPDEIDLLGNSATLEFVSGDETFPLVIRAVEPVFDSTIGAQRVLLRLPTQADLPIGLVGMLRWQGGRFSVPSTYLVRRDAEVGLLLEQDGAQTFHPLPGAIEGLPILVRLPADTKVIRP